MHSHIKVAIVIPILLVLCSRGASGCDCIISDPLAEVVFTGKVVEINEATGTAVLEVYSAWKGISPWRNRIEVGMVFSTCIYELKLGQEYLLYAGRGEGQRLVTHMCYPNTFLAEAGEDINQLGRPRWRWRHHRR